MAGLAVRESVTLAGRAERAPGGPHVRGRGARRGALAGERLGGAARCPRSPLTASEAFPSAKIE